MKKFKKQMWTLAKGENILREFGRPPYLFVLKRVATQSAFNGEQAVKVTVTIEEQP